MNVAMIEMPKQEAEEAYRKYQATVRDERRSMRSAWKKEDAALTQAYKAMSKGQRILDLHQSMKMAGLRDDGLPRLAICRSDAPKCFLYSMSGGEFRMGSSEGAARNWRRYNRLDYCRFPAGLLTMKPYNLVSTLVPMIPPDLRPKHHLQNYCTLWEVESWTPEPPKDPILLKHLSGPLYAVLAVWDLTELERSVLRGRI